MKAFGMTGLLLAGAMLAAPISGMAQQKTVPSVNTSDKGRSGMTLNQLLPLTVHEAWVKSGRNEDEFFDMVRQLAIFSANKRGVTLPNTEAAGQATAEYIKETARKDPDQLLYAVVDGAVRHIAQQNGTAQTSGTAGRK